MADDFDLRPYKDDGEDRLPWLETVQPDPPPARWGRLIGGLIAAILAVVALAVGIRSYRAHEPDGNGEMIAAQEGDYKVKPEDPGGLKVAGEGDAAIKTSAGRDQASGAIDLKAMPEVPILAIFPNGKKASAPAAAAPPPAASASASAGGHSAVVQVPPSGGRLVAAPPAAAPKAAPAAGGGGSLVQLGAFPNEAQANAAWASIAKRFAYVASLGKSVQTVSVNGKTLYRLRVNAGSANAAADICGRLKVAGEGCFIAS